MERFDGCNICDSSTCKECIKIFKPSDSSNDCNTQKSYPAPRHYDFIGFGRFSKLSTKVYFMIYLRITVGMMFKAKISFTLYRKSKRGRSLQTEIITGTGTQSGIALGSYSTDSTMDDYLAKFDCIADDTSSTNNEYYLTRLILYEANGENFNEPILSSKYTEKNIADYDNYDIENKYSTSKLYVFIQKSKRNLLSNLNEKRLLSSNCLLSDNEASFSLSGEVLNRDDEYIDNTYLVKTDNENKNATCQLTKKINGVAYLDCSMEDPIKGFYLEKDAEDVKGSALVFGSNETTNTLFCQKFYSESEQNNSSSSGGLSGGAITGIVIVCIVIVTTIGAILYLVKSGKVENIVNVAESDSSRTGQLSNYSNHGTGTSSEKGHF